MHTKNFTIDVKYILTLIQELADYEHASASVKATEESLLATLAFASSTAESGPVPLSPARPARVLLAFPPGTDGDVPDVPVGMALYFYSYSTWRSSPGIYLEDLFVREVVRGQGYGKALLQALAQEVLKLNGARLEWSVLKWNEPSIKFYESIGAIRMEEWVGMRVDGQALAKLAKEV